MCKFLDVVESVASSFVRRRRRGERAGDGDGGRTSRESARPESASSKRGSTYPSHVRNADVPKCSLSQSGDAAIEQQLRKRSVTSLTKDRDSVYPKEVEATGTDEFTPPEPKSQHQRRSTEKQPLRPSASLQRLFESQSRELSVLQQEHRASLDEKKALNDAYAALREQYDDRCKKLSTVRQERQAALDQRKEFDDAYAALKRQYDEQTKKLNVVRHERLAVLEQKKQAEEDLAALKHKCETQKGEHDALSNKYQSLKAVLEQRTVELQGAQRFLASADAVSGSEVVNALRKVNEEVHQCATLIAEWAVENLMFETLDQSTAIEQSRTLETLGTRFMQLLGTKRHKDNPILMEMALRAYLTYELYWVASPWSIGQEEQGHNMYVDGIYQRIREAEGQAVSGNWRALTRAYTLPACISDPEVAHTFDTTIIAGFADVLLAGGCTATKSDVTSALWTQFAEKIHDFVSLAGQVNKMIGVGLISEDFEVLVIWPDVAFDDRAMEDAYDNGDRAQGQDDREEIVLCATELGLMQRMRVGAGTSRKKPSELVVIKPKVALVSVIDIIE